jgi:hypothetical protein
MYQHMKKTILSIGILGTFSLPLFSQNLCSGCSTTPIFTDNLNTAAQNNLVWTNYDSDNQNGSINFTNGKINFVATETPANSNILGLSDSRDTRVYRALPFTLSNTAWRAEETVNISLGNAPVHPLMALTAGVQAPTTSYDANLCNTTFGNNCANGLSYQTTNQDMILVFLSSSGTPTNYNSHTNSSQWFFVARAKRGTTYSSHSGNIALPALNTDYTVRLERLSPTVCQLSVLTAAGQHVTGSPTCFTIDASIAGLNTFQAGTHAPGSWFRSLACTIDDITIYDCTQKQLVATALPSTICAGQTSTLCAFGEGCTSYTWQPGSLTGQTVVVTPPVTTTYTVTANCPCPFTTTVTVTVQPNNNFSAGFSVATTVVDGNNNYSITCTPTVSNSTITGAGSSYAWSAEQIDANGNSVPGTAMVNPLNWINNNATNTFPGYCCNATITSGSGTFSGNNRYKITRYVWGGCQNFTSASFIFNQAARGVVPTVQGPFTNSAVRVSNNSVASNSVSNEVALYPNPADKIISLSLPWEGSKQIELYDVYGKRVLDRSSAEKTIAIDIETLPKGIYLVRVTGNNDQEIEVTKVIKQ